MKFCRQVNFIFVKHFENNCHWWWFFCLEACYILQLDSDSLKCIINLMCCHEQYFFLATDFNPLQECNFIILTVSLCIFFRVAEQWAVEAICSFVELYSHCYWKDHLLHTRKQPEGGWGRDTRSPQAIHGWKDFPTLQEPTE
jgi:hypothetical protein